jgi:hypothetical protein
MVTKGYVRTMGGMCSESESVVQQERDDFCCVITTVCAGQLLMNMS